MESRRDKGSTGNTRGKRTRSELLSISSLQHSGYDARTETIEAIVYEHHSSVRASFKWPRTGSGHCLYPPQNGLTVPAGMQAGPDGHPDCPKQQHSYTGRAILSAVRESSQREKVPGNESEEGTQVQVVVHVSSCRTSM